MESSIAAREIIDIDVGTLSRVADRVSGPGFVFAVLAEAALRRDVVVKLVLAASHLSSATRRHQSRIAGVR